MDAYLISQFSIIGDRSCPPVLAKQDGYHQAGTQPVCYQDGWYIHLRNTAVLSTKHRITSLSFVSERSNVWDV